MPRDCIDDKSTLVHGMAWCRQATSHYLNKCWPRFMASYGVTHNELMGPGTVLNPPHPSKHSMCQDIIYMIFVAWGRLSPCPGADTLWHCFIESLYLCVCAIDYSTHVSLCSGFVELHVIHITNSIVMVYLFDAWYLYRPSNMIIMRFTKDQKTIKNIIIYHKNNTWSAVFISQGLVSCFNSRSATIDLVGHFEWRHQVPRINQKRKIARDTWGKTSETLYSQTAALLRNFRIKIHVIIKKDFQTWYLIDW